MEWHDEFKAYARAFGRDEVAAILLREEGVESLVWPEQMVEGLTFTLTADAILSSVPAERLQHVVGWVHSHPLGLDPDPSGTDDQQIRELASDFAGGVVEMHIFGGFDYSRVSVTRALQVGGIVFVSDTETTVRRAPATPFDERARAFREACQPVKPAATVGAWRGHDWQDPWEDDEEHTCPWCTKATVDDPGMLCGKCDYLIDEKGWAS